MSGRVAVDAASSDPRSALPPELDAATRHQPRARAALAAALAGEPAHAYIFRGPYGSGKGEALRAFAAELLAGGAPDPGDVRRRAMLDPSPHPDLVWIRPPGAWHLVDEIRESVIRAAAMRPAEGERRAFVIEQAEGLRDESQNALLKTLEEPAPYAHLILSCSEPELLAATILSRCQPVHFAPLSPQAISELLAAEGLELSPESAAPRLCGGNLHLARLLASADGVEIRARAESAARSVFADRPAAEPEPWRALLDTADAAGVQEAEVEEQRLTLIAQVMSRPGRAAPKLSRDDADQVKRVGRRARTRTLDLGLSLCASWYRDLAAHSAGATGVLLNSDRIVELAADAENLDPRCSRRAVELVADTRRRLRLNVAEDLALEALWLRLEEATRWR